MKCTCKQCGKTFELSDSEIDFYKNKNLNLPKRCKECRQANKQKRGSLPYGADEREEYNQYSKERKQSDNKISRWLYVVMAVSILLIILGITVPNILLGQSDIYSVGRVENQTGTDLSEPALNAGEPQETAQSGSAAELYTFRNNDFLIEHYQKHGIEMGFTSAEDYQAAANAVINNENSLHKLEAEDGDDVYYLEATNDFVIVSTDGYIRTYFRPDSGKSYYDKQ